MPSKYIVVQLKDKENIFVFPKEIDHDRMAEAISAIRFDCGGGAWERKYRDGEIISAGFITNSKCHGRSETLDKDSRPELDTILLRITLR